MKDRKGRIREFLGDLIGVLCLFGGAWLLWVILWAIQ